MLTTSLLTLTALSTLGADYCESAGRPIITRPPGASCRYANECSSGHCVPFGRGSVCAGVGEGALACARSSGPGWTPIYLQDCRDPSALVGRCLPPSRPLPPASRTLGESCLAHSQCDAGSDAAGCYLAPDERVGACVAEFSRQPSGCPNLLTSWSTPRGTMCQLPDTPQTLSTIRDGNARCDGHTDDGPALQSLLDQINGPRTEGVLYLPPCTHFIDRTLLVGDHVTIVGHGPQSELRRGDTFTWRPFWDPALCSGPSATELFDDWGFITNARYNCENIDITLQDFALDGSLVVGKASQSGINSVAIGWSGVRESRIERLLIRDVAQDAIFLRNGGVEITVRDNIIDGFSMQWHNAAGINIEMHPTGTNRGYPVISGNHIIVRAPRSTTASEVTGININRVGGAAPVPGATIVSNLIEVGDDHGSIDIPTGAVATLVADNTILPFWGQSSVGYRGPTLVGEIDVLRNTIIGGNRAVPDRALHVVAPGTPNSVLDNVVDGWIIDTPSGTNAFGVVAIKGHQGFEIRRNQIENVIGEVGLRIGFTPGQAGPYTRDGTISDNIVHNMDNSGWVSCHPNYACNLTVSGNSFDGISPSCATVCP